MLLDITPIPIKNPLPFTNLYWQAIYVEDRYNEALNRYFQENADRVKENFKRQGYTFIYLPEEVRGCTNKDEILHYLYPQLDSATREKLCNKWNHLSTAQFSHTLFSSLQIPLSALKPGLLISPKDDDPNGIYSFLHLTNMDEDLKYISKILNLSTNGTYRGFDICYQKQLYLKIEEIRSSAVENYADEFFAIDVQDLAEDVREKIKKLKQQGFLDLLVRTLGQDIIEDLTRYPIDTPLSELLINERLDIVLPGYNNFKIKLTPLPKAVYILFLRHPKGIIFKNLPRYRKELMEIYKYLSERESFAEIKRSIELVTDPTKNGINEKCSRIREAFVSNFDDSLSRHYYITGERGEPKKVALAPQLIHLPAILNRIPRTIF
jgi:hypothetical protein